MKAAGALAAVTGETVSNVVRNPEATLQVLAESAPEMYLIAKNVLVGLGAAFGRTFTANMEDLRAKNEGEITSGKQDAIAAAASAGEAAVSIAGDKVLLAKGNLSKALGRTPKPNKVVEGRGNLNRALRATVGKAITNTKAGAQEFAEEAAESAIGQFAVEQDVSKIEGREAFVGGVLGFGAGQAVERRFAHRVF